jgi:hypothetical protein
LALRLAVLQVLVTLGVTRVAGLQESAVVAVLIAAVVLAGGAIVARLAITRASVVDRPRSGSS